MAKYEFQKDLEAVAKASQKLTDALYELEVLAYKYCEDDELEDSLDSFRMDLYKFDDAVSIVKDKIRELSKHKSAC